MKKRTVLIIYRSPGQDQIDRARIASQSDMDYILESAKNYSEILADGQNEIRSQQRPLDSHNSSVNLSQLYLVDNPRKHPNEYTRNVEQQTSHRI